MFFAGFWVIYWSDEGLELAKSDRLLASPRRAASVQPPAPSRLNHELKPTPSGLYLIRAWKLPRTEPAQLLWVTDPTAFIGKEVFFLFCQ